MGFFVPQQPSAAFFFSSRRWVTSASTVMLPEVGFGVPSLASFLPIPAGPGLVAIQSQVDLAGPQRFCLARTSDQGVPWHPFFDVFWVVL